jgi:hypothetical protein
MTDFEVPTEAFHDLPTGIQREATQVDRLSYDLDGGGHFDLVREDGALDVDVEDAFRYKP